jgi:hypothetical protein
MKARLFPVFLWLLWTLSSPGFVAADVLFLNEGEEEVGTLVEIASGQIRFRQTDGTEKSWPMDQIAHVLMAKIRQGDEIHQVADLTDPFLADLLKKAPSAGDYPNSNWVTLFQSEHFNLNEEGTITQDRRVIQKILKEDGLGLGNISLYYYHPRDRFELLFAHTYAPDGRIHHLNDNALSMESIFTTTPEYDFVRKCKFAMNRVTVGSVIDFSYRRVTSAPEALFPYVIGTVFGEREPVLQHVVRVTCSNRQPPIVYKDNWDVVAPKTLTERIEREADRTIYTWEFRDPKGVVFEQMTPPLPRIFPRLMVTPSLPDGDWPALGQKLLMAVAAAAPDVKELEPFLAPVASAAERTAFMKAQALYDLILRRIRNIGLVIPNLGNLVPVPVNVTLQKKYGNNFARLCLLHFGLKALGLESDFGIVQGWDIHGIIPDLPSLGQAQDLVLRLRDDRHTTYVWCGSDYLPFGVLPAGYQGARACFFSGGKAEFVVLPEGGPEGNRLERRVFARLEANGDMQVEDLREYRGHYEASQRGLRSVREKELEQHAQGVVKRIHSQGEMVNFAISDMNSLPAPVFTTMSYRIPGAAIKAGDLLAFENLWVSYRSSLASLASRTFPLDYSKTEELTNTVIIYLPDGYDWVPWDKQFRFESPRLRYVSSLRQHGRVLTFSDRFQVRQKDFPTGIPYQDFRDCLMEMGKVGKQWIILEKVTGPSPATFEPAAGANPVPAPVAAPAPAPSAQPAPAMPPKTDIPVSPSKSLKKPVLPHLPASPDQSDPPPPPPTSPTPTPTPTPSPTPTRPASPAILIDPLPDPQG